MNDLVPIFRFYVRYLFEFSKSRDGEPQGRATTLSLDPLSSWFDRGVGRSKDQALKIGPGWGGPNVGTNADAADKSVCATMQKHVFGGTKPNIDFAELNQSFKRLSLDRFRCFSSFS
ncbi:MAG: hypothetical protein ACLQBJ_07995, partial [Bryobacteraceae bacterium]